MDQKKCFEVDLTLYCFWIVFRRETKNVKNVISLIAFWAISRPMEYVAKRDNGFLNRHMEQHLYSHPTQLLDPLINKICTLWLTVIPSYLCWVAAGPSVLFTLASGQKKLPWSVLGGRLLVNLARAGPVGLWILKKLPVNWGSRRSTGNDGIRLCLFAWPSQGGSGFVRSRSSKRLRGKRSLRLGA